MCVVKAKVALVALALLGVSFAGHADAPVTVSAADRQQILDLISASSYTYDGKNLEGYLALFTKGCVLEILPTGVAKPTVRAANRSELSAVVVQRFALLREKGIQSRHYQTNTLLTPRADGQVAGTTMLNLMWQLPGEKPYTVTTGTYHDLFEKTEGGWKLAKRSLLVDQGDMGK
jgi:3-phenylpropionate/cinnamic acid dioxygenase small subunit